MEIDPAPGDTAAAGAAVVKRRLRRRKPKARLLRIGTRKGSAKLTAAREVPKPKGVPAAAKGTFTGTLKGKKLTFKLTFAHLSGKALAAHIHKGKAGTAGPVIVPLCGPCKSPVSKTV